MNSHNLKKGLYSIKEGWNNKDFGRKLYPDFD